jgi:hypothetical protein
MILFYYFVLFDKFSGFGFLKKSASQMKAMVSLKTKKKTENQSSLIPLKSKP